MLEMIEQSKTEPSAGSVGRKKRPTIAFHEKSEKRLLAYVRAAGAVGDVDVKGLLARAVPAGAITLGLLGGGEAALANTIVYTPANITINPVCILWGMRRILQTP